MFFFIVTQVLLGCPRSIALKCMPFMDLNKVYDWFGELLEIQAIANDITSEYVPPHFVPFQLDFFFVI